jgi:hypothetical protein
MHIQKHGLYKEGLGSSRPDLTASLIRSIDANRATLHLRDQLAERHLAAGRRDRHGDLIPNRCPCTSVTAVSSASMSHLEQHDA